MGSGFFNNHLQTKNLLLGSQHPSSIPPAREDQLRTLQSLKPSAKRRISAIWVESGTTMEMGLNMDLRLSGSSVLPAYPEEKESRQEVPDEERRLLPL